MLKFTHKIFAIFITLALLASSLIATPVTADDAVITFTDAGFEAAVRNALSKPAGDIYRSELETLTELYADNYGINSIADVRYCINLTKLEVPNNHLTSLSGVEYCTKLIRLVAIYNDITDISDLRYCTKLQTLYISGNHINDISVLSYLTDLGNIMLCLNPVNDLTPISGLTKLYRLWCNATNVSDISPLLNLTELDEVFMAYNQIADISVLNSNTGIGSGDTIKIDYNYLDLTPGSDDMNNIEALLGKGVTVIYEPQSYVPPPGPFTLTVTSTGNGSVSKNPDLATYDDGTIVELTATPGTGWLFDHWIGDVANTTDNPTSIVLNEDESVTAVFLEDDIITFPDINLEKAVRYAIDKPSGNIYRSDIEDLQQLVAVNYPYNPDNTIRDISGLENCTGLTTLILCYNDITDISPLAHLTQLNNLWISNNVDLVDISPLAGLPNLDILKLSNCRISDIGALAGNTAFNCSEDWIALDGNQLDLTPGSDDMNNIEYLLNQGVNIFYSFDQFNVTYSWNGNGSVVQSNGPYCDLFSSILLLAVPDPGWTFSGWSGDVTGTENPLKITTFGTINVVANFTLTSQSGSTPGGGGGGSVGSAPVNNKRITGFWGWINDKGILLDTIEAYSVDEYVKLVFPANTICLNSAGVRLATISIEMLERIPEGVSAAGLLMNIYSFYPDGATFNPAIPLIFRYNPEDLPPGAKEENIKIVWWDKEAKKWVKLDTVIDSFKHTATAMISHFSLFSLMVEILPANIETEGLSISKTEVEKNETVEIKIAVTNTGDLPGTYQAVLEVNGEKHDESSVVVASGAAVNIVFNLAFNESGTYEIGVNGITQTLTVRPSPPVFNLEGLTIVPVTCKTGDNVQISFMIFNSGEMDGACPITATLDGVVWKQQAILVPAGSSQEVKFNLTFDKAGTHEFMVNNTLSGSFKIEAAPAAAVTPSQTVAAADPPVAAVSSPETDNRASKSNLGIILLSVLGGLLVIVLLTILIISRVKKNRIS